MDNGKQTIFAVPMARATSEEVENMSLCNLHNKCADSITAFYSEAEIAAQTNAVNNIMRDLRNMLNQSAWDNRHHTSPAACLMALIHLTGCLATYLNENQITASQALAAKTGGPN